MKTPKNNKAPLITLLGFAIASTITAAGQSTNQVDHRSNRTETSLRLVYQDSQTIEFEGGSTINVSDEFGLGFEIAYNYSSKLSFAWETDYIEASYRAVLQPVDRFSPVANFRGKMDFWDNHVSGTYNLLDGPVTPFIKAGLGFTYIDTNIPTGPPQFGCWWDPWYGQICNSYSETYSDWRFNYNLGVGIRWDVNEDVFVKASINEQWIHLSNANGTPSFTKATLEFGYFF